MHSSSDGVVLHNRKARTRRISTLASVALCLLASLALAASAQAAFTLTGVGVTPTTKQAAGHPNLKIAVNPDAALGDQNGDDLKTVVVDLAAGLKFNAGAVTAANNCTEAKYVTDTCPAASAIGTVSIEYRKLGSYFTMKGDVYKLNPAADSYMSLGFIVRPTGFKKLFFKSSKVTGLASVRTGLDADYGMTITVDSLPRTLTTTAGTLTNISISEFTTTMNSRAGITQSGAYFTFNPTRCSSAVTRVTTTSYQGSTISKTSAFTPTNCGPVLFVPTVTGGPSSTLAGAPTGFGATFTIPTADAATQQSHVKDISVTLPAGTTLNAANVAAVPALCTDAQLASDSCPAGSKIGSASATVPSLPPAMTGDIYLQTRSAGLTFGIVLRGARGTIATLRGSAEATATSIKTTLSTLPQIAFSSASFSLSSLLVNNPTTGCDTPQTTSTVLNGYSGAAVTRATTSALTVCTPETTITAGPTDATDNTPTFAFSSNSPVATFECSVNAGAFAACASPRTLPPLPNGSYTFNVRAVANGQTDATPASSAFTIAVPLSYSTSLAGSVSTTQAAAHPDLTSTVTITGNDDIKNLTVTLPFGLQGSAAAVPQCDQTNPASCTLASKIGTQTTVATLDNGSSMTLVGNIYLTASPNPGAAAGIIMIVPGVVAIPGEIQEFNNGNQQRFVIPNINNMVGPNHIHITSITFTLLGSTGSPEHPLLTNPSNCSIPGGVSAFLSSSSSQSGIASSTAPVQYLASGCASVPFTPTVTQVFTNPTAGQTTGIKTVIDTPQGNSSTRQIRVVEPPEFGPNFPAFGDAADQCPSSAAPSATSLFDPTNCPAQSKVGTLTIDTLLLPAPLVGDVYLINKSPLPWFGVRLQTTGVDIRLVGVTSLPQVDPTCDPAQDFCQSQIATTFSNLPDQPMTKTTLDLNGPPRAGINGPLSGDILTVGSTCNPAAHASWTVAPITGTPAVSGGFDVAIGGCAPETTITSGPSDVTDNTPTFAFSSNAASATFECSVNAGAFAPCTSPRTIGPLPNNSYTFNVRAVDGGLTDQSPASQAFTIAVPPSYSTTLHGSVSTTQAAAHPDITSTIDIAGNDDIKNLTVTLPFGLQGSAAAVPQCNQANPASCTLASKIGTQTTIATLDNGASMTLVGNIYLTTSPNAGAAAGIIMIVPGVVAIPGEIQEFNNGNQQRFVIPHINNMVGPNHIHITQITFTLLGSTGAPAFPLLTNPSNCSIPGGVSAFTSSSNSQTGIASSTAPVQYLASGCASVPFTPNVTQEFTNATAGQTTGVKTEVITPQGDSSTRQVRVVEPPEFGPNFPAFGDAVDQCPSSAAPSPTSLFDPTNCPAQAKVGTMTINTLLLPAPLVGDVYLINKSPLPWFGVRLQTTGVDIRLTGVTSLPQVDPTCDPAQDFCQSQVATTFSNLPDQPMTKTTLDLNGPTRIGVSGPLSGDILTVASTCTSPATASWSVAPITGTPAATGTFGVPIAGC